MVAVADGEALLTIASLSGFINNCSAASHHPHPLSCAADTMATAVLQCCSHTTSQGQSSELLYLQNYFDRNDFILSVGPAYLD